MEKITITNNTIDNFVIISPTKPQMGFLPDEESQVFKSRTHDFDSVNNNTEHTESAETYNDMNDAINGTIPTNELEATGTGTGAITAEMDGLAPSPYPITGTVDPLSINISPNAPWKKNWFNGPIHGAWLPTKYVGITTIDVPHMINPTFADFKLLNSVTNALGTLSSGNPESLIEDLFEVTDSGTRVVTIFNSLQALRLPVNRFNDIISTPNVNNYGKYYIKISPKYVDAEVTQITLKSHLSWSELTASQLPVNARRTVYNCDKNNFTGTPWGFEDQAHAQQKGRLFGSVVEVWDGGLTSIKCQKVIAENTLSLNTGNTGNAEFVLTPDYMGFESPLEVITTGDILRIYPRETYFKPIFVEVEYKDSASTLESVLAYMNNDAVRSLETGIIEIYDENGVAIDNQGNLSGTVIQKYQLSKEGSGTNVVEVRRGITL